MRSTPQDDRPLQGLRVLDFTQNLPGPYTTMVLASMGAEVIKIEPPRGDVARTFSSMFGIVNGGKKSVVLDMKDPESAPAIRRLVESADVLVEGFRPGVMARLGCGPEEATELNPRLVYCSISGYGQEGPYRDYPGHDLNYQALTGVCHMHRGADGRPMGSALPLGDLSAALTAVTSILAALYARHDSGKGRILDIAMVDTLLSWAYVWAEGLTPSEARLSSLTSGAADGLRRFADRMDGPLAGMVGRAAGVLGGDRTRDVVDRIGDRVMRTRRWSKITRLRLHALPHYAIYQTRDGQWLSVGIVDENKFWAELCRALGLPAFAKLPMAARFAGSAPLRRAIAAAIARHDLEHWLRTLDRTKIPVAPVLSMEEALRDPQLMGRRLGAHRPVHAPWSLSGPVDSRAPELGEHTREILGQPRPRVVGSPDE